LPEPFGNFHVPSNTHALDFAETHFVAAPVGAPYTMHRRATWTASLRLLGLVELKLTLG
jgi:hypothetical protein